MITIHAPRFTQYGGECSSKEWIAKQAEHTDDGQTLWLLIKMESLGEDDNEQEVFKCSLFSSINDIDWLSMPRSQVDLMMSQEFLGQYPDWTKTGTNALALLHEAVCYASIF